MDEMFEVMFFFLLVLTVAISFKMEYDIGSNLQLLISINCLN